MRCVLFGVALVAAIFFVGLRAPAAAGRTWIEVKSPHFAVMADSGEKSARSIAWQFEQVRHAIESLWSWARVDFDKPLVVIAVGDENGMRAIAPQFWEQRGGVRPASVFVTGADRYYMALRADIKTADTDRLNPYVVAYWSYVALVIETAFKHNPPMWFSRGLASVMSNTIVRESHLEIGHPIPWHLRRLQGGSRLRLRELVGVDRASPWYTQADRLEVFDAECWAFVHYLMFGDEGAHRSEFDRFLALVASGSTPDGALESSLGNLDALEAGFAEYLSRQLYQYLRITVDTSVKTEAFATNAVSDTDSLVTRSAFHVAMGRPAEARNALDQARQLQPDSPGSYGAEGLLVDYEGKLDEAAAAYAKAVDLGSKDFYVHYRLAQLLWARSRREDAQKDARDALALAGTTGQRRTAQELVDRTNATPARPTRPVPPGVYRAGSGILLPRLLTEVKPAYTTAARDAKVTGTVVLDCIVGVDGQISDVKVVRSLDSAYGLDDEAVKAVRQWRFAPGTKDGKPVPVFVSIEMQFTLK